MRSVRNILLTQAAAAVSLAGLVWIWLGSDRAVPTLLGGLIGVVPNTYLAVRLFSPQARRSAKSLMRAGWMGELGKLAIAAALFAIVFAKLAPLHPGFVFAGYIATLLALPLAVLFYGDERTRARGGR